MPALRPASSAPGIVARLVLGFLVLTPFRFIEAQQLGREAEQTPRLSPSVGLSVGIIQWDLAGTGSSPYFAIRADAPLGSQWILGEASVGYFSAEEQFGLKRSYFVPEVQLHFQWPLRYAAPYLGVGAGAFRGSGDALDSRSELTTSAALGFRSALGALPFSLRGELRIRGIGSEYTASAAEWTAGISWRF